jgi:hypothetical protein
MCVRFIVGLALFLMLLPAFPEADIGKQESPVLNKLDEIVQRLDRMEQDLRRLNAAVKRISEGQEPVDVHETPEYRALKKQFEELQEKVRAMSLRSPTEVWGALGDPKELARRLVVLAEGFSPTISEPARREEFEKDVRKLREQIETEAPVEVLYKELRKELQERLCKSRDEREKAWVQGELDSLEKAQGHDRKMKIDRYVRMKNARAIHSLAEKYAVPREQMVKSGLPFVGYGRRAPGPFEPRDRGAPPKPGPRGPSGPRGDRR